MEAALGGSLHMHIKYGKDGHLSEEQTIFYTAELIAALLHMKLKYCMHRDIKVIYLSL